jgi:hypothetical protein
MLSMPNVGLTTKMLRQENQVPHLLRGRRTSSCGASRLRYRASWAYFVRFGGGTIVVDPIPADGSPAVFLDSTSVRKPVDLALTSNRKRRDSIHRNSLISCCIRSNRRSIARNLLQVRITAIKHAQTKESTRYSGFIT